MCQHCDHHGQLIYTAGKNDPRVCCNDLHRLNTHTGAIEPWQAEGMPPVGLAYLVIGDVLETSPAAKSGVGVVDAPVRSVFTGAVQAIPPALATVTGNTRVKLAALGMVDPMQVINKRSISTETPLLSDHIGLVP